MLSFGDMGEIKMVNAIVKQDMASSIEQVLVGGDLASLTSAERVSFYHRVCESIGLNPLTKPFEFLRLNGKLVLYARRDAADQLRTIHGISLSKPHIEYVDDLIIVTIEATNKHGRTDTDLGAVSVKGLQGEAKANAILKCVTKAKRRVTLSIAGLGWLDETEVDTIPGAQRVTVDTETGEIVDPDVDFGMGTKVDNPFDAPAEQKPTLPVLSDAQLKELHAIGREFYGDEWDEQRPKLVQAVSKGAISSSKELTPHEADKLIAGIKKKAADVAAKKQQAQEQQQAQAA